MGQPPFPRDLDTVLGYFPELDETQVYQLRHLDYLYRYWNPRINLISRADLDNLYIRHVLHALSIARFAGFNPGCEVMDLGTGGGFPGIPLAIVFPEVRFLLVDLIEKKIRAVEAMYRALGLQNVGVRQAAAETLEQRFDFVLSRAVAPLSVLDAWSRPLLRSGSAADVPNGLIALKGGDLTGEMKLYAGRVYSFALQEYFSETFFRDKWLVYLPLED
jgi:16S rRNA (guanine527-N7)-methyltransferase